MTPINLSVLVRLFSPWPQFLAAAPTPLSQDIPLPVARATTSEAISLEGNVFTIPAEQFSQKLQAFIDENPELRIVTMDGDGRGYHGYDTKFTILTRPALRIDPAQEVLIFSTENWPLSLREYVTKNPEKTVVAVTGLGTDFHGYDSAHIAVVQK